MFQRPLSSPIKVGIIGCGNISETYLNGCVEFPALKLVHLADLDPDRAKAKAEAHGIARSGTPESLLADDEVDLVVNLTIPRAHTEVNRAVIQAGKHLYCEKPFGLNADEAASVLAEAAQRGLLVGSAPDTFLGPVHQTCRRLIDSGAIGEPVAATAFFCNRGHERWHPSPAFYYDLGGGPMFDMGPYYLTALVDLLGPMRRVSASARASFPQRITPRGEAIPVKTPTHLAGTIDFANDAIATVIMSFDIWGSHLPLPEIHGSEGSITLPDPNSDKGAVRLRVGGEKEWREIEVTQPRLPARGAGVADLAHAIRAGRLPRASGQVALHVIEAMQAFEESSCSGAHRDLRTRCERPAAVVGE